MKSKLRRIIAKALEARVERLIRLNDLKVVAITGSVGKTSTKLAIAKVLQQKYRVLAHPGNFNSEIGLPLSIFELDVPETLVNPISWLDILRQIDRKLKHKYPYDVLVLEMGADQVGDIQKFMRYIKPDIGVITAIEPAHMEQFGSVDAIAREKMSLAHGSKQVLANTDNERVASEVNSLDAVLTYGLTKGDFHFDKLKPREHGGYTTKLHLPDRSLPVETKMIGQHSQYALIAAAGVASLLGLSGAEIVDGIASVEPTPGRMNPLPGLNGSLILDDTYNSSPSAAVAALRTLMLFQGRKIAVMGSMNELGTFAEEGHRQVGKECAGLDILITIGSNANEFLAAEAERSGLERSKIHCTVSPYEAGQLLAPMLKSGDTVLAKGSQNGVFAEETVAMLLANPDDKSKLVRQGQSWQDKKRKQFGVE